jgi:hypothetical protein
VRQGDYCRRTGRCQATSRTRAQATTFSVTLVPPVVAGRARKRGPVAQPVDPKMRQLEVENRRLRRKLARAETIIALQTKVAEILGFQTKVRSRLLRRPSCTISPCRRTE